MTNIKNTLKAGIAAVVLSAAIPASANLITNGSFEDNDIPYGTWRWFTSDQVDGWDGSNIEIWDHLGGEPAYHGEQFAELNAHPRPTDAFSIFQDFETEVGQTYNVSFAYQARRSSVNETFLSEILDVSTPGSSILGSWTLDDHTTDGWSVLSSSFVASSTSSRIQFTTITPTTYTYGNFLDDVKVSAVPEPSALWLLGLGMIGLGLSRRKLNK